MLGMFFYNSRFNQDISSWDVSSAINIDSMFEEATSFNQDLSHWNVNKVIDHDDFESDAGFDSTSKLPHFKN